MNITWNKNGMQVQGQYSRVPIQSHWSSLCHVYAVNSQSKQCTKLSVYPRICSLLGYSSWGRGEVWRRQKIKHISTVGFKSPWHIRRIREYSENLILKMLTTHNLRVFFWNFTRNLKAELDKETGNVAIWLENSFWKWAKDGKIFFVRKSEVCHIFDSFPLSQIRKILKCASGQFVNPQILWDRFANRKFLRCTSALVTNPQIFHHIERRGWNPSFTNFFPFRAFLAKSTHPIWDADLFGWTFKSAQI
jgi:hypothetical protein